jgi:hypothetical protein
MRAIQALFLFASAFFAIEAIAGDPAFSPGPEPDLASARAFSPTYWTEGLHLTAGVGIASSIYTTDTQPDRFGIGPNIRTEVGWYLYNGMALELSSAVNIIRVSSSLKLWDTQFALGIRTRIGRFFSIDGGEPYLRLYAGWGPAVAVFSSSQSSGTDRIHLHGPLGGIGFGQAYSTKFGTVIFVELGATTHAFRNYDEVRDAGVLPQTLAHGAVTDGSQIFNAHLSVGLLAF